MSGFSFNGVHSDTYHVEYIPNPDERWFEGPDFELYGKDVSWRRGGYGYGSKVKIRTITLNCWFDQITRKEREDIRRWLGRDKSGKLVLDDMPFVYWNVTPGKTVPGKLYNDHYDGTMQPCYSGTFSVSFTAYDPFGYLMRKSNAGTEEDGAEDFCPIIPTSQMPAAPTTASTYFQVYNAGTEKCGMTIKVAGTCSHAFRFRNATNGTMCVFRGLPPNNAVVKADGDSGAVTIHLTMAADMYDFGFEYHDRGYVLLDSGMNAIQIEEENSAGSWGTPTTLAMSAIAVDYAPRLL